MKVTGRNNRWLRERLILEGNVERGNLFDALKKGDAVKAKTAFTKLVHGAAHFVPAWDELGIGQKEYKELFNAIADGDVETAKKVLNVSSQQYTPRGIGAQSMQPNIAERLIELIKDQNNLEDTAGGAFYKVAVERLHMGQMHLAPIIAFYYDSSRPGSAPLRPLSGLTKERDPEIIDDLMIKLNKAIGDGLESDGFSFNQSTRRFSGKTYKDISADVYVGEGDSQNPEIIPHDGNGNALSRTELFNIKKELDKLI